MLAISAKATAKLKLKLEDETMNKFFKITLAVVGYLAGLGGMFALNLALSGIETAMGSVVLFVVLSSLMGIMLYAWHKQSAPAGRNK